MKSYSIAENWFVCERAGHAIFLDLKRERYLALGPADAARFREVLHSGASDVERQALAKTLEDEGLLISGSSAGTGLGKVVVNEAARTCWGQDEMPDRLTSGDLRSFLWAWTRATIAMKVKSLRTISREIQSRRAKKQSLTPPAHPAEVCARCRAFFLVHPMFTDFNQSRLLRSLALIEFLARYDIYANWVYGVTIQPFDARSWVQCDDIVLDDTLENVRAFSPIMVV